MKMGKRRRGEASAESDTPAKKEKATEFNGTVFKAMLKEPTTAMKGESTCSCTFVVAVTHRSNFTSVF